MPTTGEGIDGFAGSCDRPLGPDGEFCKHCVATELAWLGNDLPGRAAGASPTRDDVRAFLEDQEKVLLGGIVMEQAMRDEGLRERLLLRVSRMSGLDLTAFHRAIPWRTVRDLPLVSGVLARRATLG